MAGVVLFNIWFYVVMVLYTAVAIPLLSLVILIRRPFCTHRQAMGFFRRYISLYGRGIVSVLTYPCVRVRYRDFAGEKKHGPFVYVCNHRSSSDPFLLAFLPGEIVQVVNKWPFRLPAWGPFARMAGYISVREMPFEAFKTTVLQYLAQGVSIAAFPEGTRSASKEMGQFHGALFRTCLDCEATIVPVCIMGNEDKPRRGSLLIHPGVVRVHRLAGLGVDEYKGMTPFALKNHVRALIADHISKTEGRGDEAQ